MSPIPWFVYCLISVNGYQCIGKRFPSSESYFLNLNLFFSIFHTIKFVNEKERLKGVLIFFFLQITSCGLGSSEQTISLCTNQKAHDIATWWPVIGRDKRTYRNKYCAICNSLDAWETPRVQLKCQVNQIIASKCLLTLHPMSEGHQPACTRQNEWRVCRDPEFYELCLAFRGPVYGFRNYFCYLCHVSAMVGNQTLLDENEKHSENDRSYIFGWYVLTKLRRVYEKMKIWKSRPKKDFEEGQLLSFFDVLDYIETQRRKGKTAQ